VHDGAAPAFDDADPAPANAAEAANSSRRTV